MVAVHVGNQDGFQRMERQLRVQNLMLGALTTIDQVPALSFALSQGDAGDVSYFGGYTGGGA
ncbi:conserved hypothetical protein [Halomonas sp. 59]|nr:conserved hypothetical protein [Halomonas sp. I3]CAD5273801.1 conserved hypothetical protein [Halomonas sp. 113]CAD5275418.1 conserved hypothetical protein [Halomonas sp. 59]CAD5278192.1 conserved hypothetical protein [Halomonas sp. 156]VXB93324.1 conserved hypothetical protein [Halomonas titanicae]